MVKLFFLLLISCVAGEAIAQKTGEILIVSPRGESKAIQLINSVKPHYPGVVTVMTELPEALPYDAVMIYDRGNFQGSLFDSLEQARLIDYVTAGGKFYAEGDSFRDPNDSDDGPADNQFWDFIGDSLELYSMSVVHVDNVRGIAGEFTEGMQYTHPYNWNGDAMQGLHIEGMKKLMVANDSYGIAYITPDTNIKAVLHWPIVNEHYSDFLAQVVCTYFQLCILDVPTTSHARASITFDSRNGELRFPSEGNVEVIDILGRQVLSKSDVGMSLLLPKSISAGTYIVHWRSKEEEETKTIVIH